MTITSYWVWFAKKNLMLWVRFLVGTKVLNISLFLPIFICVFLWYFFCFFILCDFIYLLAFWSLQFNSLNPVHLLSCSRISNSPLPFSIKENLRFLVIQLAKYDTKHTYPLLLSAKDQEQAMFLIIFTFLAWYIKEISRIVTRKLLSSFSLKFHRKRRFFHQQW